MRALTWAQRPHPHPDLTLTPTPYFNYMKAIQCNSVNACVYSELSSYISRASTQKCTKLDVECASERGSSNILIRCPVGSPANRFNSVAALYRWLDWVPGTRAHLGGVAPRAGRHATRTRTLAYAQRGGGCEWAGEQITHCPDLCADAVHGTELINKRPQSRVDDQLHRSIVFPPLRPPIPKPKPTTRNAQRTRFQWRQL